MSTEKDVTVVTGKDVAIVTGKYVAVSTGNDAVRNATISMNNCRRILDKTCCK